MTSAEAKAEILIVTPGITVQDLIDFSSHMDAASEDRFWKRIREIAPTLWPW
ncbi:hypothetical protein ABZW11_17260 [Nonomuraea sp. NPDC004580]|uniref:hypothetical protein n=1 Tax=Nonomuraea sp. NPDC004580 TaxID=3154552 RepID=UPI00339FDD95